MKQFLFLLFGSLSVFGQVNLSGRAELTGNVSVYSYAAWSTNQTITLDNTSFSSPLTNYAFKVNVTYNSTMNYYFSDLRFRDSGGGDLSYWMQEYLPGSSAIFWVKVPLVPASSTYTITMWYGNPNATDASNGDATFDIFDTFGGQAWKEIRAMPQAKQQHGFEALNGKLYALGGGDTSSGYVNSMFAYDPTTDAWTTKAATPSTVQSPGVRAVGGYLWYFGGLSAPSGAFMTNGVYQYNPTNDTWATKAVMPWPVEDMASAVVSNRYVYLFGGWGPGSGNYVHDTVQIYDTQADSWTTNSSGMTLGRCLGDFAAADGNGNVYCFTSVTNMSSYPNFTPHLKVDRYVPSTGVWSAMANAISGSSYKEIEVYNNVAYTWTGSTTANTTATDLGQAYDIAADAWTPKVPYPLYETGASMAQSGGYIYVSGGTTNNSGPLTTNRMFRYDPSLDVSNAISVSKWTVTLKGSVNATNETREGFGHLAGVNTVESSANMVSVGTVTNNFAIEIRRRYKSGSVNLYTLFGFGAGPLVDNSNASTTWEQTNLRSGYTAASVNTTTSSLRRMPTAGSVVTIGSAFTVVNNPPVAEDQTLSYDDAGHLRWSIAGTLKDSATDTTFVSTSKNIFLSQGRFTTTGFGGDSWYDWVIVRKYVNPEPVVTVN